MGIVKGIKMLVPTSSYTLTESVRTSAGVYSVDGTKVRELWSNELKGAAVYATPEWDGLDNDGNEAAPGPYNIKVVANNVVYEWEGVIGNNSDQKTGITVWAHYEAIFGMTVVGNYGYVCMNYNEGSPAQAKFLLSNPHSRIKILPTKRNAQNTPFVASDGTNVFWAGDDPFQYIKARHFVFASKVSDDTETIFSSGQAYTTLGNGSYQSIIAYRNDPAAHISGMAVQQSGNYLFVSRTDLDIIDVYHRTTGAFVRSINIFTPAFLCVDGNDNLWVEYIPGTKPVSAKLSGTPYGSKPYQNNANLNQAKAFDANSATYYSSDGNGGGFIGLDFGTSKKVVNKVRIYPYANFTQRAEGVFEITNAGRNSAATPLKEIDGVVAGQWNEFTWNSSSYRQFARLKVSGDYASLAEMELWGYELPSNPRVEKFTVNSDGTLTTTGVFISDIGTVSGLAFNPAANQIAIADRSNETIRFYNNTTGAFIKSHGQVGGYVSGPNVEDDKYKLFYFNALAFQPDGKMWVGDYGNCRLQKWNAALTVKEDELMVLPHNRLSYPDKNNPSRVFCAYWEFEVDYTIPLSHDNDSWKLVRNWGYGINDNDNEFTRLSRPVTLSNGRTYAMHGDIETYEWHIMELTSAGMRFTGSSFLYEWVLMKSGAMRTNLGYVEGQPSAWREKPLTGFTVEGNPIWGSEITLATTPPATNSDPLARTVNPANVWDQTEKGYFIGWEGSSPPPYGSYDYHLGAINPQTNKWMWKTARNATPLMVSPFLTDGSYEINNGVSYCGGPAVAIDKHIFWCFRGEFWKENGQSNKWQHIYENGLMLGQFGEAYSSGNPIPDGAYGMAGSVVCGEIIKIGNAYYLYHCDENGHGGIHRWKITGLNTIQEHVIPITK